MTDASARKIKPIQPLIGDGLFNIIDSHCICKGFLNIHLNAKLGVPPPCTDCNVGVDSEDIPNGLIDDEKGLKIVILDW